MLWLVAIARCGLGEQAPSRPPPAWIVTEFDDRLSGRQGYGKVASRALSAALANAKIYRVVPEEDVERAVQGCGLKSPFDGLVNLRAVGERALEGIARNGVIVRGEVLQYRIDRVRSGRYALVALRMLAYDVERSMLVSGALVKGESEVDRIGVSDARLISAAIQQAAVIAEYQMRVERVPEAKVMDVSPLRARIDGGSHDGFKIGDIVYVVRDGEPLLTATVSQVEFRRAEIVWTRALTRPLLGDQVQAAFPVPWLPRRGQDVFKPTDEDHP